MEETGLKGYITTILAHTTIMNDKTQICYSLTHPRLMKSALCMEPSLQVLSCSTVPLSPPPSSSLPSPTRHRERWNPITVSSLCSRPPSASLVSSKWSEEDDNLSSVVPPVSSYRGLIQWATDLFKRESVELLEIAVLVWVFGAGWPLLLLIFDGGCAPESSSNWQCLGCHTWRT